MVEVGGALGPSFEAQALNLSQEGMSLRTAYLPEVGQPVMCRFDAGPDSTIVAAGEVLWNEDMGNGGAFGIRFTNLDSPSMTALQRVLGIVQEEYPGMSPGRKVRLHIEGLASPMRARVKDRLETGVTAYSDLGFLEMGKTLHLEDAETGRRRPAFIDRVQVETNQGSNIPQLVVSLRYDDAPAQLPAHAEAASLAGVEVPSAEEHEHDEAEAPADEQDLPSDTDREVALAAEQAAEEPNIPIDEASLEAESQNLKSSFARNAAKVAPALLDWAKRAKVAAALLAARARRGSSEGDVEIPLRRTTAPAPGGGLHAAGRKVVRGNLPTDSEVEEAPTKSALVTKKRMAIAGTIGLAAILATMALRKPAAPVADNAGAPPADTALAATQEAPTAPPTPPAPAAEPAPMTTPAALPASPIAQARKPGKPMPFTNGSVGAHPNIIKIKMDGPVEGILGATQPSGFTIVTPNTKANDSANSLAAKDPRLEGVRISNEPGGAEFTVSFKDGVPNYIVRARGDVLEMVLADPNGNSKLEASSKSTHKSKKKSRHHR